jgi:hypothetical protein
MIESVLGGPIPPPPPNSLSVLAVTPRKIVQIAISSGRLCALCNDNSIWHLGESGPWVMLPSIPQPEVK